MTYSSEHWRMKQDIDMEWDKLPRVKRDALADWIKKRRPYATDHVFNIGEMIEFLGDEWINVFIDWNMEQPRNLEGVWDALWKKVVKRL